MRKHPRPYPPEFRQEIIEVARSGPSFDELAREFSLAPQTVRNWCKQHELDAGTRSDDVLHRKSRGNYGRPRLQADLRDEGIPVSERRVTRLMHERNLQGATLRSPDGS